MYGPQLAACGLEARAPRRCRGDGVYRCMRAQCLCTRHAGWKPAHPGGAGVMECIAVCGLDARAPRRGISLRQAGSPSSRHAGWTPAHPGGISLEAGWKPALPGGVSLYAGCKPAHPACGCDARVLRGDVRSCDPAHHIQQRAGRPVMSQRTFRAFFVGIWSVIGAIATRCIVWQIVVVHGAESSL
jgi:hypothetical protein